MSSSPYATGGGGVRLEHVYAATLLAAVVAGDPIGELGDRLRVARIRLQAGDVSSVDDIVIEGYDSGDCLHRVSIGVRRDPKLITSDKKSVPLIASYLKIVVSEWRDVASGVWSLVLAVAVHRAAHDELDTLTEIARSTPDSSSFEAKVACPGSVNERVRTRLKHMKALVAAAATDVDGSSALELDELTWRFLAALKMRRLRLEGSDLGDRTDAVKALRRVAVDESAATAEAMFLRIAEITSSWASHGALITEAMLRKELGSFGLKRSDSHAGAWRVLDRLGSRLRDSIRPSLGKGSQELELERPEERHRLIEKMRSAGMSAGALVVTGDPDVGKSALSLRALEDLRAEGAAVVSLGLRDLPSNVTEFEGQLGGSGIDDVLATGESRLVRLLLIDSAESVLEGKEATLQALAQAALNAGIGVVAVTRTDGARPVGELLARSSELSGTSAALCDHIVRPLTDDEQTVITRRFPVLSRLEGDLRTSWLLGRPGLVDVLLQTGQAVDPADFLCEADVFMSVWHSLIRNDEICQPGAASPDDRDRAAIYVAQRTLGGAGTVGPIQGTAAAELRSIGVLRSPNNPALSPGDEFATDLFRDFALCRLFLTQGWDALASAGAPRWSIRAARLGCQALLAQDRVAAWARLSEGFGAIVRDEGARWLEIPYEALLTLGDADSAIRELWGELTANDGWGLRTLLRLAHARYVNGATGDPFALAPLVKATFCELPIDQSQPTGRPTVDEARQALVLAWLRGMAIAERPPNSLRMEVRDIILDRAPSLDEDFVVEALATLGQDIDDRAEAWLREVARQQPHRLNPAVESPEVARSLSPIRPSLLLHLAESYYTERPRSPELWGGGRSHLDDGIRGFRHGPNPGFGVPQAAWYYGPFFSLLNTKPLEAVGLINRMLDHAAAIRVEHFRSDDPSSESETPVGVFLDIPEIGSRLYVGDSHVWAWYRGTGIGPHPCMSALLALERFIDH